MVLLWMFLSWIQVKCSLGNAADHHIAVANRTTVVAEGGSEKTRSQGQQALNEKSLTINTNSNTNTNTNANANVMTEKPKSKPLSWRESFRRVSQVPAFASPLTPVLNPIVGRAQWEIVVRSAAISIVICGAVVGALMGVPVPS